MSSLLGKQRERLYLISQGQGYKGLWDRNSGLLSMSSTTAEGFNWQSLDLLQRIMESMGLSGRMEDTALEWGTEGGKRQEWNEQRWSSLENHNFNYSLATFLFQQNKKTITWGECSHLHLKIEDHGLWVKTVYHHVIICY